MHRLIRAAAIASAVAVIPVALAAAAAGPSGTYTATLTKPASQKGTWRLTFSSGGRFTVRTPAGKSNHGTDMVSGSKITFQGGGQCKSAGSYKFTLTSTSVTFKKIKDPCPRATVLTAHAWKKA